MPKFFSILLYPVCCRRIGVVSCALFFLAPMGCVHQIVYNPDDGLIEKTSVEAGALSLEETLSRALAPEVAFAEVTPDMLRYEWLQTYLGAFFQPVIAEHAVQIFFRNIARVELYDNHKVSIWQSNDRHHAIQFSGYADARKFADLVLSFRRNRLRQ